MTAYYILTHTITDSECYYVEYVAKRPHFLQTHGGEMVVAASKAEALQREPQGGVVIVRFPSEDAIHAFVNAPEYQPLKKLRLELTTDSRAVLAPALEMPE